MSEPVGSSSPRGKRLALAHDVASTIDHAVTPRQLKLIQALAREAGITEDEVKDEAERMYGRHVTELSRRDASAFIEHLQERWRLAKDLTS